MWNSGLPASKVIHTAKGDYVCQSDDIETEAIAAARFAGLRDFNFRINGLYIDKPEQLPTKSINALCQEMAVESAEVTAYDTAG